MKLSFKSLVVALLGFSLTAQPSFSISSQISEETKRKLQVNTGVGGEWATDYRQVVTPAAGRVWSVNNLQVIVPDYLTVSNQDVYAPRAHIVWHGDPAGNRKEQVRAIFETAASAGLRQLRGSTPVNVLIEVAEFHALSPRARARLSGQGVHNITFVMRVTDARTGQRLVDDEVIRADIEAYTGTQAIAALEQGLTQKIRLTRHLASVVQGFFGQGPDPRRSFSRRGR